VHLDDVHGVGVSPLVQLGVVGEAAEVAAAEGSVLERRIRVVLILLCRLIVSFRLLLTVVGIVGVDVGEVPAPGLLVLERLE